MATPAAVLEAIDRMLPPLLETLERVLWVQRYLYPPAVPRLAEVLAPQADALAAPLGALEQPAWPDDAVFIRERLLDVGRQTLEILAAFAAAARAADDLVELFRKLRRFARVQETLYPLAPAFDPVSRWFLDPAHRGDDGLVVRLREATLQDGDAARRRAARRQRARQPGRLLAIRSGDLGRARVDAAGRRPARRPRTRARFPL